MISKSWSAATLASARHCDHLEVIVGSAQSAEVIVEKVLEVIHGRRLVYVCESMA
jgi:hypothetical protein